MSESLRRHIVWGQMVLALIAAGCTQPTVQPIEPQLDLIVGSQKRRFSRSSLLSHPKIESVSLIDRSGYQGQPMRFRAIPFYRLWEGLNVDRTMALEFQTSDGFSSSLEAAMVLAKNPGQAMAYLAVEDPAQPWPNFARRTYGAGPFYLIWKNDDGSVVSREEWPFKVQRFELKAPIAKRFPKILPDTALADDAPERRGFTVYVKFCFPCHALGGQGTGIMGPDLNRPMNPTQYFQLSALKRYIREPRTVRSWPEAKMPGFPKQIIPDDKLDDLIVYLSHMAARQQP